MYRRQPGNQESTPPKEIQQSGFFTRLIDKFQALSKNAPEKSDIPEPIDEVKDQEEEDGKRIANIRKGRRKKNKHMHRKGDG